jgi:alpha-L-fucosidase
MFVLKHHFLTVSWTALAALLLIPCVAYAYEPTWESLDSRPLPTWYDEAKVGIFIHWGVFSVPAFESEWFWYQWRENKMHDQTAFINATELPRFNYPDYAHRFDATLYNPDYWAQVFAKSGAQYVVFTSKHHEGYCMWDSRNVSTTWNWNVMDIGPRRDLLGDLAKAIRQPDVVSPQTKKPLKFGTYHSLFEWFNPLFLQDEANKTNFKSQSFVDTKTMPELYHLVETYKPDIVWSDGHWMADSEYWKSKEFLAWLATNSSVKDTVVWNDRWGSDVSCKHGSFFTCSDNFLPNTTSEHKFENAMPLDKTSWGWNRKSTVPDYLTTKEVIDALVKTIARNGNINVNVGPAADGTISPGMVDRLLGMGEWLSVNGEGVYGTRPWKVCSEDSNSDGTVFYTRSKDVLYAHLTKWPSGNDISLSCPERTASTVASMLGLESKDHMVGVLPSSSVRTTTTEMTVRLPALTPDIIPCQHVWVIAMRGIGNLDGDTKSKEAA